MDLIINIRTNTAVFFEHPRMAMIHLQQYPISNSPCHKLPAGGNIRKPKTTFRQFSGTCFQHAGGLPLRLFSAPLILAVMVATCAGWNAPPAAGQDAATFNPWDQQDERLTDMVFEAQKFESDMKFAAAAESWTNIAEYLAAKHGLDSWQVTNARLAAAVAHKQTKMTNEQVMMATEMKRIQSEVRAAIAQKNAKGMLEAQAKALRIAANMFGPDSHIVADIRFKKGQVHHQTRQFPQAMDEYQSALNLSQTQLGRVHPTIEQINSQMGKLLREIRDFDRAIQHLLVAEQLAAQLYGKSHEAYAVRVNDLGVTYYQSGNLTEAIRHLRKAESIRLAKLGPDHEQLAHSRLNLGLVKLQQNDYSGAKNDLASAAKIFQTRRGHRDDLTLYAKSNLATALVLSGDVTTAESTLSQVYRDKRKKLGHRHPSTSKTGYQLAVLHARQGNYESAEPLLVEALNTQEAKLGLPHQDTQNTVKAYVLLLERTGRSERAAQMKDKIRIADKGSTPEIK